MLKRPRSTTPVSSDCSDSSSDASSPRAISKYTRLPSSLPGESLKCTLPPLCSSRPTFFSTVGDLERHYAKIHELVCEAPVGDVGGRGKGKGREKTCGKVFPERRYLELHQNEFHNPLLEIERDQGSRTYECFLPPSACPRKFLTVKARRLHLVDAHRFPTDFYFAIIKFGNPMVQQLPSSVLPTLGLHLNLTPTPRPMRAHILMHNPRLKAQVVDHLTR
ncbi:Alpha-SNAP protein [Phaffia rhodozyma]|uniref:Alpha-SNAP protein n=1 Tax=Phaffia rhodozyma TaxID=264483 RepID=A0A0F7SJ06_PHARH|nr:Alpha-SNAP protein [Phaffia rhodozyma]